MTRHRTERLTVSVFVAVGGLLLALFTARAEIAVLTVPWLVLLAAGLITAGRPQIDLSVSPAFDRSTVGEEVDVTYTFTVRDVTSGTLYATWPPPTDGAGGPAASTTLARPLLSGEPVDMVVPFKVDQWGTYDAGRVNVRYVERFGLVSWSAALARDTPIRVHPDELQLRELMAPTRLRRQTGAHQSRLSERGLEFAGVRPLASGDSIRDVNWRASARREELWVSERHPDRSTDVVMLIDSFPESYGLDSRFGFGSTTMGGQSELLALVVRMSLALAGRYLAATDRVGLVELGGIVRWVGPSAGRLQLYRLIDAALATVPYRSWAKRDLSVVPARAIPPDALVIAISPLVDDRFTRAVTELAGGGHDVAVVVLEAPVPPEVPDAVRLLWQAERQMARDQLTNHGIASAQWNCEMSTIESGLHVALEELQRTRRRLSRPSVMSGRPPVPQP